MVDSSRNFLITGCWLSSILTVLFLAAGCSTTSSSTLDTETIDNSDTSSSQLIDPEVSPIPVTEVASTQNTETPDSDVSASSQLIDPEVSPIPVTEITWTSCYQVYECGDLEVPLDYANPSGESINIGLIRISASVSPSLGPLLINFGGPGASGTELVYAYGSMWEYSFPEFDVIGFDPRGVGQSTQVNCPNDLDDDTEWILEDGEDVEDFFTEARLHVKECLDMSGDLAFHVGTNNVARDMDQIRLALGEEQITYLGYSYGTRIGAVYASLFPDHVRAMILDGAVAPSEQISAFSPVQGLGFENAWNRFAKSCDEDTNCILNQFGGAENAFSIADELLSESNLNVSVSGLNAMDGRELTRSEFQIGTASALYSPTSWPALVNGLYRIIANADGSIHQFFADQLAGRNEDGTYDNSQSVLFLVRCADDPLRPSDEEIASGMDAVADQLPHFGPSFRGNAGCAGLDEALDPLHVGQADLDVPALVISMEGDPATPIEWGPDLVESMGNAVLITSDGEGHTAFLTNSECVTDVVFDYLLELTVLENGWSCEEP